MQIVAYSLIEGGGLSAKTTKTYRPVTRTVGPRKVVKIANKRVVATSTLANMCTYVHPKGSVMNTRPPGKCDEQRNSQWLLPADAMVTLRTLPIAMSNSLYFA